MNLAELKDTLTELADEAPTHDVRARLGGVDQKVQASRRNKRVAGGIAALGVVAAAALIGPQAFAPDGSHSGPTDDKETGGLPVVVDQGVAFYTSPAGNRLLAHEVGDSGQQAIRLNFVPPTSNISVEPYCASNTGEISYAVNGHPIATVSCDDNDAPIMPTMSIGNGSSPANERAWADFGVKPGEQSIVTATFDAKEVSPDVVLGLAVYDMAGERIVTHGQWIDKQVVVDGHTFELTQQKFEDFSGGEGHISLSLPNTGEPVYVGVGVAGVSSSYSVWARPGSSFQSQSGGPSQTGDLVAADTRLAKARIRARGDDADGLIYILVYERAPDAEQRSGP